LGHDGILHVSSDSKKLYALDLQGNSLWAADLGAASEASPALACNPSDATLPGIVYVGANDGKLYAFITDSKGIDVKSPWPKFHRDPRNSGDSTVDLATFECK
jgi:outer membrane protein assembly factor BamB